jgi:protein-L-isoaspartate(D-aspartate) O-methyltransferase
VAPGELEAQRRNEQLVEQLEQSSVLHDPAVATAFRAVLRHHFLPDRTLDEVYEDTAITTRYEAGVPVSSSSQPAIMAIMLELLRPLPGHRVLEIGTGTGYNAALIAHLVGREGHVVSLDIERELTEGARDHLARAGAEDVEVVAADGAAGWAQGAPFDRIIVTAGADDLSPAWADQLAEGGRLVLPLALAPPGQQCAAFVREERSLVATELAHCGFMPLRGGMAPARGIGDDEQVAGWLAGGGRPTGQALPLADVRAGFLLWLSLTTDQYVCARPAPDEGPTFGIRDEGGMALVVADGDDRPIVAYGDGDAAAARLVRAHVAWASRRPALDRLRVVARPAGDEPAPVPAPGVRIVRRPRFTFVVSSA